MKQATVQTGRAHGDAQVKGAMPGVKDSHPAPAGAAKQLAKGTAPASGQTYRKLQTGSTDPKHDIGGGVGNTSGALDKYLGRK